MTERRGGGGLGGSLAELDRAIAAAKAELEGLVAEKSRAQAAALPTPSGLAVPLYAWQERALEGWRTSERQGVVQAVTGAGKTRVGVAAIAEALASGRRAVVLVPTLFLVRQWLATLSELLPGVAVSDRLGDMQPWQVLVTTVQSAMRRPALPFGERALVVADECHRYGAEGFAMALRSAYDWRLGLTATLERGDDGDDILNAYFGGVVHDLGYGEALADELISPFRFAHVSVPLLPKERAEYDQLTEELRGARQRLIIAHGMPDAGVGVFLKAVSELAKDHSPLNGGGLARRYMSLFSRRRALLAETPVKMRALKHLGVAVKRSKGSIVFTQTKGASMLAAETLRGEGCSSAAIHGELEQDERDERIELFRDGAVTSLTAPRVLDEGVDVPEADLAIVMAANRSRRQMIQRLGRVLRRRPGKTARFVVMYAEGTVEDPFFGGHSPDFYEACLPFAEGAARFDLGADEIDALIAFLTARPSARLNPGAVARGGENSPSRKGSPPAPSQVEAQHQAIPPGELLDEDPDEGDDEPPEICGGFLSDDPVRDYLRRAGAYPLLNAATEVELARQIEAGLYARHLLDVEDARFQHADLADLVAAGEEALDRMICSNLRLVISLAKRYTGRGMEFIDLIQEGNIGLIHAVEKFDFHEGTKFSTYATWWVRQAITRAMADKGSFIRMPVHMHEIKLRVERFRQAAGATWSELLLCHPDGLPDLGADRTALRRIARLAQPMASTEYLAELAEDSVRYFPLLGEEPGGPEGIVERLAVHQELGAIMARLEYEDPRGAFVLRARYGAVTGEPETLDMIGRRVGLTRERVRQIEKAMMARAREIASEEQTGVALDPPRGELGSGGIPPRSVPPRPRTRAEILSSSLAPLQKLKLLKELGTQSKPFRQVDMERPRRAETRLGGPATSVAPRRAMPE